jgi:hypothetical protein
MRLQVPPGWSTRLVRTTLTGVSATSTTPLLLAAGPLHPCAPGSSCRKGHDLGGWRGAEPVVSDPGTCGEGGCWAWGLTGGEAQLVAVGRVFRAGIDRQPPCPATPHEKSPVSLGCGERWEGADRYRGVKWWARIGGGPMRLGSSSSVLPMRAASSEVVLRPESRQREEQGQGRAPGGIRQQGSATRA